MISFNQIKIKDLLSLDINLRELDLLVADRVMKEVNYFKKRNSASINSRLIFETFAKELEPDQFYDHFGDLKWTKGNNNRYFTENLPHYSTDLKLAKTITNKFVDFKTEMKEAENESFEFSYINKKTKDSISVSAKTAELAICFASLHLIAELNQLK